MSATAAIARLCPWLTYPAWVVCGALAVWAPLFPAAAERVQYWPFALGLVLLGLPHGAMDHLAGPLLGGRPLAARGLGRFFGAYLAAVLLFLALWHLCPSVALGVFLLLSWLHWGQGDYDYLRLFEGRPRPPGWGGMAVIWLVRGGLPIVLPILAFPAVFVRLGADVTRWYGGAGLPAFGRGLVGAGLSVLVLLTVLSLGQSWRADAHGPRRLFRRDLGELLLLWALFGRVPPVLAVGAYFCVWHSARHLGRWALLDPAAARLVAEGRMARGAARLALLCLPMTLGAIALLVGLYFSHPHGPASLPGLIALYLSLIAALTVPHFAVVLWMDRRQGL